MRLHRLTLALILAVNFAALAFGITRIAGLETAILSIMSFSMFALSCWLIWFWSLPRRQNPGLASAPIAMLALVAAIMTGNLVNVMLGHRPGGIEIWRQSFTALFPMALYPMMLRLPGHRPTLQGLELGVAGLALLCGGSILLDTVGVLKFESYGLRHFGFMSDGAAWAVGFTATFFVATRQWPLTALSVVALLMTQSRGALLVFMISTLLLQTVGRRQGLVNIIGMAALGVLGYAAVVLALDPSVLGAFDRFSETDTLENDRVSTALLGMELFQQGPVFGLGFNAQQFHINPDVLETLAEEGGAQVFATPTSTIMKVLTDAGMLGFLAFLAMNLSFSRTAWRMLRTGAESPRQAAYRGLAAWLLPFLWVNQFAAWLLPASYLTPLVFLSAGLLAGRRLELRERRAARRARARAEMEARFGGELGQAA